MNEKLLSACESVHLKEDGLQLPTVFPTVLLREEDRVCWDAVVGHPAVALQHPYHYVWETVLRLGEGHRARVNLSSNSYK